MQVTTISDIITKRVLNEDTGELESKDFREERKRKQIRGGFRMTYKTYDEALITIVKSSTDLQIVIYIRDLFTYQRIENPLPKADISKVLGVSNQKVTTTIKRMVTSSLLRKVSRGVYRLNPYMYIPFRSDTETLQAEWTNPQQIKNKEP